MALLTVVNAAAAGVEVVLAGTACAAGGDSYANTGQEVAIITNSSGAPINVTIATPCTVDSPARAVADRVVAVAAGATSVLGPFKPAWYSDASGGIVNLTYSGVTTLFIKVLKVTPA